jgi:site-specific DNA recombinase
LYTTSTKFFRRKPLENKGLAALYIRVSTMNQVDRDSLSTQESRLKAYCEANGFRVYKVYKDAGASGKDIKRTGLESLMDDAKRGKFNVVLVTALDRITRSLRDLIKLVDFFDETNIRFVSITQNIDSSTSFGRFMRDLLGLIARLEREVVAERVAGDMHHRALLGKWNGGIVPYGYTTYQRITDELTDSGTAEEDARKTAGEIAPEPKKLYPDQKEADVVRRIFNTFIETRSIRKTTHTLNSLGIKTRRRKAWASSTIHRILSNPTYTGKIWYGKRKTDVETGKLRPVEQNEWKVVGGHHEPIVDEALFKKAQDVLKSIFQKPTRAYHTYLLSGLLRCGKCGGVMHGYTFAKKSSGKEYRYYKCHNYGSKGPSICSGMTVQTEKLDNFVIQTLANLSKDKPFLQDKEKMLSALREEVEPLAKRQNLEALRKTEKELENRIETLVEKLEAGLIDDIDFRKRYEKLKSQLSENRLAQESTAEQEDLQQVAYEALSASFEEIASFGKNWEFLDDQAKARKISTIVREINVLKEKVEMQVFLDVNEVSRTDRDSLLRQV